MARSPRRRSAGRPTVALLLSAAILLALSGCGWIPALVGTLVATSGTHQKQPPDPPGPETLARGAGPFQILAAEPAAVACGYFLPGDDAVFRHRHLGVAVIYKDERFVSFFQGDGTGALVEADSILVNGESPVALADVPAYRGRPAGLAVATRNTLEYIRWETRGQTGGLEVSFVILEGEQDLRRDLVVGDFDGDGRPDIAVSSALNGWVEFYRAPWEGRSFESMGPHLVPPAAPTALTAADYFPDREHRSDLALMVEEGTLYRILLFCARPGLDGIFCGIPDASTEILPEISYSLAKAADLPLAPDGTLSATGEEPSPVRFNLDDDKDGTPDIAFTRKDGTGSVFVKRPKGLEEVPLCCTDPAACGWGMTLSLQNRGGSHFSPGPAGIVLLKLPDGSPQERATYGRITADAYLESLMCSYYMKKGKDFDKAASYSLHGKGIALAAGDLDGNGWDDIVAVAGGDGRFTLVTLLANRPYRPEEDPAEYDVTDDPFHFPFGVAAGEVRHSVASALDASFGHAGAEEGEPFLASMDRGNREVIVDFLELRDGAPESRWRERYPDLAGRPQSLLASRLDGDPGDDILVCAYDRIYILRNRGPGSVPRFSLEEYRFIDLLAMEEAIAPLLPDDPAEREAFLEAYVDENIPGPRIRAPEAGPLDGNPQPDLVLCINSNDPLKLQGILVILNGLPSGSVKFYRMEQDPAKFSRPDEVGHPSKAAIANLDGDGALDLAVAGDDPSNVIQILFGDPGSPGRFLDADSRRPPQILHPPLPVFRRRTGFNGIDTDNGPPAAGDSPAGWPRAKWIVATTDYYAAQFFNSGTGTDAPDFQTVPARIIYSGDDPESVLVGDFFAAGPDSPGIAVVDENTDSVALLNWDPSSATWAEEPFPLEAGVPQGVLQLSLPGAADPFLAVPSRSNGAIEIFERYGGCPGHQCGYRSARRISLQWEDRQGLRAGMALVPCPDGGSLLGLLLEDRDDVSAFRGEIRVDLLRFPAGSGSPLGIGALAGGAVERILLQDVLSPGILLVDRGPDGGTDLLTYDPEDRGVYCHRGLREERDLLFTLPGTKAPFVDWQALTDGTGRTLAAIATSASVHLASVDAGPGSGIEWSSRRPYGTIRQVAGGWTGPARDPRKDLFVAVLAEEGLVVETVTAGGKPSDPQVLLDGPLQVGSIGAADVNGDGRDDLAVVDGLKLRIFLAAKGKSRFSSLPKASIDLERFVEPVELIFLEANGDARTDIAFGSRSGEIFLFLGNGYGDFGSPAVLFAAPGIEALRARDLDGDGTDEILAAASGPGLVILPGRR